jgi:Na+/melibiose symporter-like transporter
MKKHSSIFYQIIAISLIVVVGIHSFNSFFNTHRHRLADGTIIVHAHPYDQKSDADPFKKHTHTGTELVFLANLSNFLPALPFIFLGIIASQWEILVVLYLVIFDQFQFSLLSLRGPPEII